METSLNLVNRGGKLALTFRGARQALAFFTKVGFQRQLPRLVPPALRKTGIAVCALHSHMETLEICKLGSIKFTTLKDLYN